MAEFTLFIDTVFDTGGFWPAVSARAWVEGWRIPSDSKDSMLAQCLLQSIIDCNDALKPAQDKAIADGHLSLSAYIAVACPMDTVGGVAVLETLYLSAVGNLAKAKTIKRLQAQIRKPLFEHEAQAGDNSEQYFLDEHQNAISRILTRMAQNGWAATAFGVYVGGG